MPQMLHEHFACARSGPFPFRSRSVPRSVFGPAFPGSGIHVLHSYQWKRKFPACQGCSKASETKSHEMPAPNHLESHQRPQTASERNTASDHFSWSSECFPGSALARCHPISSPQTNPCRGHTSTMAANNLQTVHGTNMRTGLHQLFAIRHALGGKHTTESFPFSFALGS